MNPDGNLDRDKLRRNLSISSYDPLNFLFSQANNEVSLDTNDVELRLVRFFNMITADITDLSNDIEGEIAMLQRSALTTENFMLEELEDQSQKLIVVENAIEDIKEDFQSASDGAVRVGNKLANSERERQNIKKSIDLMKLIIDFQNSPEELFSDVLKMNAEKLRESLPDMLRRKDWYYISQVLYDLRKILFDINSEEVQNAQQVVINITEVVEMELLGQFDVLLDELMENQESPEVITRARTLAECLHLFNNGQSLHKRYIFSVVEKRIPSDAFLESHRGKDTLFSKVSNAIKKHGRKLKLPPGMDALALHNFGDDDHASDSSSGASASEGEDSDEEIGGQYGNVQRSNGIMGGMNAFDAGDNSLQLLDHLSRLFTMINRVCVEQFAIIKKVFPAHTIPRVTRQLIQRIFNDPAFGIQARVDAILNPQPPAPPLSLSDYLDALLTVREKLSALNVLLLECAADAAMIGMGSEVISMRKAKKEIATCPLIIAASTASSKSLSNLAGTTNNTSKERMRTSSRVSINLDARTVTLQSSSPLPTTSTTDALAELYLEDQDVENEEKLKSDAEIREFFYEQSSQVLVNYLHDYFDKETLHVKNQYVSLLRKAVDEHGAPPHGKVSAGTLLQLPHFRAERMKSIAQMVATVANNKFLDSIFIVTTDAVMRMESIGRDDKKLPNHIKDLYLLQLGFIAEGLMLPWSKGSITMLLRLAGSKPQNTSLPPVDVLPSLVALTYGKYRLNAHFNEIFQKPLSVSPNLIAACKESKKKYFAMIRRTANETVFAWTLCVVAHLEKLLLTLQGKYDYNPILDTIGAAAVAVTNTHGKHRFNFMIVSGPSSACDAVCKAFIQVTNAVRRYETDFVDLDFNALFWRPFGQQFIGLIIAHLRRQSISIDGARQLRRDLEEYRHVTALMNSAETSDMIGCLEEIVAVFEATNGDEVMRVVTEELRHLDTSVVLGLVRVRADFNFVLTGSNSSWAKALSAKYLNYKWDTQLPWETRKPVTILSFRDAMNNANSTKMGPKTLRRSGNAMPNVYVNEAMRLRHLLPPSSISAAGIDNNNNALNTFLSHNNANNPATTGTRAISLDLRALESGRQAIIDRHIRETELQSVQAMQQEQQQHLQMTWGLSEEQQKMSRFLPTRPDEGDSNNSINNNSFNNASSANTLTVAGSGNVCSLSTNGMGYAGANALPQRRDSNSNNTNNNAATLQRQNSNKQEKSPKGKNMFEKVTNFFR